MKLCSDTEPMNSEASGFWVTVLIWFVEGERERFEAYEKAVAPIIAECGGAFRAVYAPSFVSGLETDPDEVHVLRFDSEAGFRDYMGREKPESVNESGKAIRQKIVVAGAMGRGGY